MDEKEKRGEQFPRCSFHEAAGVSTTIVAAIALLLRVRRESDQQAAADCPAGDNGALIPVVIDSPAAVPQRQR
ncbi:MAG: hypothetical protein ACRDK8_08355 [Solirubrobacteraceae bacterium]